MFNNDDIMDTIRDLHKETTDEIKEINQNVAKLDKKIDVHIAVANEIEKRKNKDILTKHQKIGIILTIIPISIAFLAFLIQ